MKGAASHLVNKRGALRSSATEEFYRQKLDGSRKLLAGGKLKRIASVKVLFDFGVSSHTQKKLTYIIPTSNSPGED